MINVGSYLVIFCLAEVLLFGVIEAIFVCIYITELKHFVHRKYEE